MEGYSAAFDEYRMDFIRTKFGVVLSAIAAIVAVCGFAVKRSRKTARDLVDKYTKWQGGGGVRL